MLNTYYQIVINGIAGTGTSAGGVDPNKVENYMPTTVPTDFTASENKRRGNLRYEYVIQSLQLMGNIYVESVAAAGGDANTIPTTVTMTVIAERGDDILFTPDENNSGATLTGADAIKRCVARALIEARVARLIDVYDPTASAPKYTSTATTPSVPRVGNRVEYFDVGALANNLTTAEAAITVTQLW